MWKRSGVRISREWFPRRQYRRCWDNRTIITFYFSLISLKWGGQGIKTDKVFQLTSSVLLAVSDLLSAEKLRKCWNYVRLINAGRAGWVCAQTFLLLISLQLFVFSAADAASLCCSYWTFYNTLFSSHLYFVPTFFSFLNFSHPTEKERHDMDQVGDIVFCSTIGDPNIEFLTNWKQ